MSNLQTYYHFKLDFQKMDQHTGGKWLIHGTKRRKDNQLQSLELNIRLQTIYPIVSSVCSHIYKYFQAFIFRNNESDPDNVTVMFSPVLLTNNLRVAIVGQISYCVAIVAHGKEAARKYALITNHSLTHNRPYIW